MVLLKRKIQNLHTIITRICYRVIRFLFCFVSAILIVFAAVTSYAFPLIQVFVLLFGLQDLVFFTEDCAAIDTGHTAPYYAEDRLQLLQEER